MNTTAVLTSSASTPINSPVVALTRESLRAAPALCAITVVLLLATLPTFAAMAFDPRLHQGINIWIKPLKFEIALAVYTVTLAIFARWLPSTVRQALWFRAYVAVTIAAIVYEILWIGGAAAYGVGSHFNKDTTLMIAAYALAGLGAVTLTSLSFVFGVAIARNPVTGLSQTVHRAVSIGLIMTFALTVITAGYMSSQPSHFIGGNLSDAESWPIMGWATDGGDLRVAHFFATHAMHALPIVGLIAAGFSSRRTRGTVVWAAALLYVLFVAYAFVEAVAGRSFLSSLY